MALFFVFFFFFLFFFFLFFFVVFFFVFFLLFFFFFFFGSSTRHQCSSIAADRCWIRLLLTNSQGGSSLTAVRSFPWRFRHEWLRIVCVNSGVRRRCGMCVRVSNSFFDGRLEVETTLNRTCVRRKRRSTAQQRGCHWRQPAAANKFALVPARR